MYLFIDKCVFSALSWLKDVNLRNVVNTKYIAILVDIGLILNTIEY